MLIGDWLEWLLAAVFLALALWTLLEPAPGQVTAPPPGGGIFPTAALGFFLLEMADKTQIVAIGLAMGSGDLLWVYLGAVAGVILVNAPAIWLGQRFAAHLPLRVLHAVAALILLGLGVWFLFGALTGQG